jgi:hypothetical protein
LALLGLLGDLNNAIDFSGTASNAVRPLIAMTNTCGGPWQLGVRLPRPGRYPSSKAPLGIQLGAMIYFLPCALALIVAITHQDEV